MFIVLSSLFDPHVTAGLDHFRQAGADARLVTCHDLARPGWRLTLDDEPTLVVDGQAVAAANVQGVLTRLPWVTGDELPFVHEHDRAYAAAEMQAFLLALLTQLRCPVVNRASPGCLAGPAWSPERWTLCAAQQGLEVRPIVRRAFAGGTPVDEPPPTARRVVQVVHGRVLGDVPRSFQDAAAAVALAAHCDLLRVAFEAKAANPVFLDADVFVDLSDREVADATLRLLSGAEQPS
jgi:hypothetical protein